MCRRLQSQSTEATTGFRGGNKRVCHSTWEFRGFQKVANCLVRELGMKHLSQGERGSDEDRPRENEREFINGKILFPEPDASQKR